MNTYWEATSRNLGLVDETEQRRLRSSTVAIAGVGAVGGHNLITLVRMGVGRFVIADPDRFEVVNLHRQYGAFEDTVGRAKVEVMMEQMRKINPEVEVRSYAEGVNDGNLDSFLDGVDLVLDGIDYFQVDARRILHRAARKHGLFIVFSAPLGYGASLQVFDPAGMSLDEYAGITPGMPRAERLAAFSAAQVPDLATAAQFDTSRVDFEKETGPALASAVMISSGLVCNEVLRILAERQRSRCIPHGWYFDPRKGRLVRTGALWPLARLRQRLLRREAFRRYATLSRMNDIECAVATEKMP